MRQLIATHQQYLSAESEGAIEWLKEQASATEFRVSREPLESLAGWIFDDKGNLRRADGAFFSVEGLQVIRHKSNPRRWSQPIIVQHDVGLLGLLVRRRDGLIEGLFQAKAEPGHINAVQIGPTVQATRSNFLRAHGGSATEYLDMFKPGYPGRTVVDTLQSEQGSRFLRKHNRNMVIEVAADVPATARFRWIPLRCIGDLLTHPDTVNMDTRSVLSCLPLLHETDESWLGRGHEVQGPEARPMGTLFAGFGSEEGSRHSITDILSWLSRSRQEYNLTASLRPLKDLSGWTRNAHSIHDIAGKHFEIIGVRAEISHREVRRWYQPLIAPTVPGLHAFLVRTFNRQLHVLVKAKCEAGTANGVEIGPTVQCWPRLGDPTYEQPPFLDRVLSATSEDVMFRSKLSEEGGRFYQESSQYCIVKDDNLPDTEYDGFLWVTPAQLCHLAHYTGILNIEARSLLTCIMAIIGR